MDTLAIVLKKPGDLGIESVELADRADGDVVVDVLYSGISTGTERLLFTGAMPPFPGMGYPLVPGYETVGVVSEAGETASDLIGQHVFVPGARCFKEVHALFGGAAARLVVPAERVVPVSETLGASSVLIALAATAHHAVAGGHGPELIVGHGVLGRLMARLTMAMGHPAPRVWESNDARASGASGYEVVAPGDDTTGSYRTIMDASGDAALLDTLIGRLSAGGEIALAGFYHERVSFAFPPAFMREARLRVAAQWQPQDLEAVTAMIADGRLSLDGLITHARPAQEAVDAYPSAFGDPECLKMVLDWRSIAS